MYQNIKEICGVVCNSKPFIFFIGFWLMVMFFYILRELRLTANAGKLTKSELLFYKIISFIITVSAGVTLAVLFGFPIGLMLPLGMTAALCFLYVLYKYNKTIKKIQRG
ncbi:MAG: hypothetical protein ACYCSQ_00830 [bacterium]